jgi:NADH-quinone oxidoreductase subunit M
VRATSIGATLVNLITVLTTLLAIRGKGEPDSPSLYFMPVKSSTIRRISFAVGADGVSLILALLTTLVMLAAIWQIQDRPNIFYISSLLIGGGALGAFLTTDVVLHLCLSTSWR